MRTVPAILFALLIVACGGSQKPAFTIGALGDSITTGADTFQKYDATTYASIVNLAYGGDLVALNQFKSNLHDNPELSWAGGTGADRLVTSHYWRLYDKLGSSLNGPIASLNLAKDGAVSADLPAQAQALVDAATDGLDYVTILIGANDVCHNPTPDVEVDTTKLADNVSAAIRTLVARNAAVKIVLVPIPRVTDLPTLAASKIGQSNVTFQQFWDRIAEPAYDQHLCDPLLLSTTTQARRDVAAAGIQHANQKLKDVVAPLFPSNVKYAAAAETAALTLDDVSQVDAFHPSVKGQNRISEIAWGAGWYP